MAALAASPSSEIHPDEIAARAGWPDDPIRAAAVARTLMADGLITTGPRGELRLP
jgi:hypothetical protein